MANVAVIQTAFPGDVVLCSAMFAALADAGHTSVAVVRPETEPLLRHNPNVGKIICLDKTVGLPGFIQATFQLRQQECDLALLVQRHWRSALLALYAGIPRRIGFDIAPAACLYTEDVRYEFGAHEVDRCLSLCRGIAATHGYSPAIYFDDQTLLRVRRRLGQLGIAERKFIAVAPGSIWPTKRWPHYARFVGVALSRWHGHLVLVGSQNDRLEVEAVSEGRERIIDLCGQTDILESAAIIKEAVVAVTNDSAPAHIAAAVGTPVISIFGPTIPQFGFYPYAKNAVVIENKGLYCRPCSSHGSRRCPESHFRCLTEITPDAVWAECQKWLR